MCTAPVHFVRYAIETKPSGEGWISIRVVVPFKSARRDALHYWLGWNGNRWARSKELRRISEWYPEIIESLTAHMEASHATH